MATIVLSQVSPSRRGTGNTVFIRGVDHWRQGAFRASVLTGSGRWQYTDSPYNDVAGISGIAPVWVDDNGTGRASPAAAGDSRFFQGPPTAIQFLPDDQTSTCHATLQLGVQG